MKRIILLRHGESQANKDPGLLAIVPDFAIKLTSDGIKQSKAKGKELKEKYPEETFGAIVSPFYRTRETCQAAAEHINFVFRLEDPRIREQEFGNFITQEQFAPEVMKRDSYSRFWYRMPNGESGADVFDRAASFINDLHKLFVGDVDNLIIFTHGMFMRIFIMVNSGLLVEDYERMKKPNNCGTYTIEMLGRDLPQEIEWYPTSLRKF